VERTRGPMDSFVDYPWFVNSTSQAAVPTRRQQEFGGDPSGPVPLDLRTPWPNPASRAVSIRFRIGMPAIVRAEVFDVMSCRISTGIRR